MSGNHLFSCYKLDFCQGEGDLTQSTADLTIERTLQQVESLEEVEVCVRDFLMILFTLQDVSARAEMLILFLNKLS